MRTVVYILVLLVVVGMILTMVGSALAATATPTADSKYAVPGYVEAYSEGGFEDVE